MNDLTQYLQNQLLVTDSVLNGLACDLHGQPLPKRSEFKKLEFNLKQFLAKKTETRIFVLPGLRGVGKTTLLAQLYLAAPRRQVKKLYLRADELVKRFDANLWKAMEIYEEITEERLENLSQPMILFLDEIQYDESWPFFLKSIFDRSKKIFVFATGSSALLLKKSNADLARRAILTDINPLNFSEFLLIKKGVHPQEILSLKLSQAIFQSQTASQAFIKLSRLKKTVNNYWLSVDPFFLQEYLKFGCLPFTINLADKTQALKLIGQLIEKVVYLDIPQVYKFDLETLNKIEKILFLISDSLEVSVNRLASTLSIKTDTLSLILDVLQKVGFLIKIPAAGGHYKQARKPAKFLFAAPSLRFYYLNSFSTGRPFDVFKGSLLEDAAASVLKQVEGSKLSHDAASGGADFILNLPLQKIVVEVGAKLTMQKVKGNWGIIISEKNTLQFLPEKNLLLLPLKFFLLI